MGWELVTNVSNQRMLYTIPIHYHHVHITICHLISSSTKPSPNCDFKPLFLQRFAAKTTTTTCHEFIQFFNKFPSKKTPEFPPVSTNSFQQVLPSPGPRKSRLCGPSPRGPRSQVRWALGGGRTLLRTPRSKNFRCGTLRISGDFCPEKIATKNPWERGYPIYQGRIIKIST